MIDDTKLFNDKLQELEDFYNYHRPHGSLDGQTPMKDSSSEPRPGCKQPRDPTLGSAFHLLDQSATGGVTITPEHGDAPVRIGTRDFNSLFQGAISRVAIFNRKLADREQAALQTARTGGTLDSAISATTGLVGFWRLGASA